MSGITKIPPGVTIVTVPRTVVIYSGMPRNLLKKQLQSDVWVPKFSHATSPSSILHIFIDLSMHTSCTEICKAVTIRSHILLIVTLVGGARSPNLHMEKNRGKEMADKHEITISCSTSFEINPWTKRRDVIGQDP